MANNFCNKCGKKLRQDDVFCPNCGVKIQTGAELETTTEQAQEPGIEASNVASTQAIIKPMKNIYIKAVLVHSFVMLAMWGFAISYETAFYITSSIAAVIVVFICSSVNAKYAEKYHQDGIGFGFAIAQGMALILPYMGLSGLDFQHDFDTKVVLIPFIISYVIYLVGLSITQKNFPEESEDSDNFKILLAQGFLAMSIGSILGIIIAFIVALLGNNGKRRR